MSVNPFANAQVVCCGGVDTCEVDETTMESKLCPGLYLCGEILDVDGICGGYNLQVCLVQRHDCRKKCSGL